ncbi:MAG TPA: radical SAM protein [Anaerolineae bacterium]|nr:radical SAM protein [Anaerolineae bacterium]
MSGDGTPIRWETALPDGRRASLLVRPSAINLLLDGEQPSFTFDPLGRLHGAFYEGRNYRRSLGNRVLAKWTTTDSGVKQRQRRWLDPAEAQALVRVGTDLAHQTAEAASAAPPAVQTALASLTRWHWTALEADRARFQQIYTPIGILPPDQYLALVLQATHGCSHNACTFCTFYQDIPFRIKTPEQFRQHVDAVLAYFGPALAMRRCIFLADANALVAPMGRLRELLQVLGEGGRQVDKETSRQGGDGETHHSSFIIHRSSLPLFAFIDAFHVERKSVADWQELGARGLARVYIGMESGHDPLLRWLNKPGDAGDVLDAVTTLKAAGLQASVIIMLGVGGERYANGHVRDTVALLNAMPLGRGDLVYFSDFVAYADAPYAGLAAAAGITPLEPAAVRAQEAAMRAGFVARDAQQAPQFARYDINEFVY